VLNDARAAAPHTPRGPLRIRSEMVLTRAPMTRLRQVTRQVRSFDDLWLAVRMFGWACSLRVLKHVVPLPKLVRWVRQDARSSGRVEANERRIATFARWSCRLTQWSSGGNCLERGLLMYRFLGRVNARPSLALGFAREPVGALRGHAWVIVDDQPLGETPASLSSFQIACTFDPQGLVASRTPGL